MVEKTEIINRLQDAGFLPLIQVHLLRPVGPGCLNRDNNQRQKTITIGGTRRIRISSQCKKHAIRNLHRIQWNERTIGIVDLIVSYARHKDNELSKETVDKVKAIVAEVFGAKAKKNDNEKLITPQLITYSEQDVDSIYLAVMETIGDDTKKAAAHVKQVLNETQKTRGVSEDIALYGRFSTSEGLDTIYSATHFNHSYGINEMAGDIDDFTAIDSFLSVLDDEMGAGHLNSKDINGSILYEYANVSLRTLFENLYRDDMEIVEKLKNALVAEKTNSIKDLLHDLYSVVGRFINDVIIVVPEGMQNSMATYSEPLCAFVTIGAKVYPRTYDTSFVRAIDSEKDALNTFRKAAVEEENGAFACNEYLKTYYISNHTEYVPDNTNSMSLKGVCKDIEVGGWITL